MKTTLLLVEDEPGLASSLQTEFELENMNVIWAKDGMEAINEFQKNNQVINVIILDWMLPKLDGFSVLRRIRKTSQVPIVMLTARDYIGDKIAGLTSGADDYLTKPFEMEELIARVELALKHGKVISEIPDSYSVDNLIVDLSSKRVSRNGQIIPLTQREYELLVVLIKNEDKACSRDDLLDKVWGNDFDGQPNILDVYIRNLRSKLSDGNNEKKIIHTVRGIGYMISENVISG